MRGSPHRLTAAALLLAALQAPAAATAKTVLSAAIDRDTITVGDPILLTLRASAPSGEEPSLPLLAGETIGPFEILEELPAEETVEGSTRAAVMRLRITSFGTGDLEIPALEPAAGGTPSEPIRVAVLSVGLDPNEEIRDVKPPVRVPRNWLLAILPVLLILLVAAAVLYLVRRARRQRRIPVPSLAPADLRPAHEIALEALAELERESAASPSVPRAFFFRLSDIVREYIDRRYALPAPERTSREILREIRRENLPPNATGVLRDFFARCDLVKYRGIEPSPGDVAESLRVSRDFVETTRERALGGAREEGTP